MVLDRAGSDALYLTGNPSAPVAEPGPGAFAAEVIYHPLADGRMGWMLRPALGAEVRVNGQPVLGFGHEVRDGDTVTVGPCTLEVTIPTAGGWHRLAAAV